MCRYCVEYGSGTKWYLNPQNYQDELYAAEAHANATKMLGGAGKNRLEVGGMRYLDANIPDLSHVDERSIQAEALHAGQVVPLEDALGIIDLCKGDFLLMHCACRRYFGRKDQLACLFFWPVIETALAERPWETDSRVIAKEEAKAFEVEMDRKGLVHTVFHAGVAQDGVPPIVICHCAYPDCMMYRLRFSYDMINATRKGEYVAVVDRAKCQTGCRNYPVCMPRCNFGAMRYSPTEKTMHVIPKQCFGCGVCRSTCPTGALELVNRSSFPALVDEW